MRFTVQMPGVVFLSLMFATGSARGVCPVDFNGDGFLDSGDISLFVDRFLTGDLSADMNGDGFLDSGDIAGFVSAFLEGCPSEQTLSPQSNHGALTFEADQGSYLLSDVATRGQGVGHSITGDLAWKKQLAYTFWLRWDGGEWGNSMITSLSRGTSSLATELVVGVRANGPDGNLYLYARSSDGDWINVYIKDFVDQFPVGEEVFVIGLIDSAGLDSEEFGGLWPGQTAAMLTWQEDDADWTVQSQSTAFPSGGFFGQDQSGATSEHRWRVGDSSGENIAFSIRDVAVFDDLSELSSSVLVEMAKGALSPKDVAGCLRWWELSDTGEGVAVTASDITVRDVAGEIASNQGLGFTAVGGVAPRYTANRVGPKVDGVIDPIVGHDFSPTLLTHGLEGLEFVIGGADADVVHFGDSYAFVSKAYTMASAILGAGPEVFPVVGVFQGAVQSSVSGNHTIVMSGLNPPVGAEVRTLASNITNRAGGAYDNQIMIEDASMAFAGFPVAQGYTEIFNNSGAAWGGLLTTVSVNNDLFRSALYGATRYDWLTAGTDRVALRVMSWNDPNAEFGLKVGTEDERHTAGDWALGRWSMGGDPFVDGARSPSVDESYAWFHTEHTAATVGPSSATFALSSPTGISAGKYAHLMGFSAHKVDGDGNPLPGINFMSFNVSSADDDSFTVNGESTEPELKQFSDEQLLEVWDGACWAPGRRLLVVYDIEDNGTWDPIEFVTRVKSAADAIGYSSVHFLFVSQFMHAPWKDFGIYVSRRRIVDRERSYMDFAAGRTDCSVLSLFGMLDGAMPGGYSQRFNRIEPMFFGGYLSAGYPERERRTAREALESLGIPIGVGGGAMLDEGNLHRNASGSGQLDAEAMNGYWLREMMGLGGP